MTDILPMVATALGRHFAGFLQVLRARSPRGPWELSADRANVVRPILAEGVPPGHIFMVAGKSDTEPLFADDPYMSPNRRVTIILTRDKPPIPVDFTP
jgi:chemotaxis protein MotB